MGFTAGKDLCSNLVDEETDLTRDKQFAQSWDEAELRSLVYCSVIVKLCDTFAPWAFSDSALNVVFIPANKR